MATTTIMEVHDQIENLMDNSSCMAGFFNLFDPSHLISAKRLYPKRLPPSQPLPPQSSPVPDPVSREPPKSPLAISPWKFTREAPRLSLDSRAVVDSKGGLRQREIKINTAGDDKERENQRPSPSVIARLMGLDRLPSCSSAPEKKVEHRRSAYESRSRDDQFFCESDQFVPIANQINTNAAIRNPKAKNQNQSNAKRLIVVEKKCYYNTADFLPPEFPARYQQQQHQAITMCGEIERILRMRGIDDPSKDLETLKHILEALQLKGLLHSSAATVAVTKPRQNLVFDRRFSPKQANPSSPADNRRRANSTSGDPSASQRRERTAKSAIRSTGRSVNRSSSPVERRKGVPLSIETQRRGNETTTTTTRGSHSLVHSPRMTRARSDQTVNRTPRNRRSTVEICQVGRKKNPGGPGSVDDEASTVSESSFSTSSHTESKRWRHREGRNLLERCDKLLHNIAEMNSNSNSAELQQPSPVSVLDPFFYKDDESSPSPVKKRTIDFKDQVVTELEDELWSPSSSTQLLLLSASSKSDHDIDSSDDSDYNYVSKVLGASNYLPDDADLFLFLEEKQNSTRGKDNNSKASFLQRKLIFDTITEILDRNRQLSPWKSGSERPKFDRIWSEFQGIRERGPSEDLFKVVCGVLKKDLAGDSINGWGDCHVEVSEAVVYIERLIFKDLIDVTIRDLAAFAGKGVGSQAPRRKLVF